MILKVIFTILAIIVAFIATVCIFYISRYNMILKDRSIYSYTPPSITTPFPKLIHQTWKTKDLDPDREKWQNSVLDHYPDYKYTLWLDADIEKFAQDNFPWYMDTWNKLTPFIKKVDTIRYMWMYILGGIYFDLDVYILKRMDHLLLDKPGAAFIPTNHDTPDWSYNSDKASPAILASYPGNPIWLEMLEYIRKNINLPVLQCTGPVGLSNLLKDIHTRDYPPEGPSKPNIVFLSEQKLGIGFKFMRKYSYHVNTGSW